MLPPEIWTRIFRICILDMRDWVDDPLLAIQPKDPNAPGHAGGGDVELEIEPTVVVHPPDYLPFARTLSLVCRQWHWSVTSDGLLLAMRICLKGERLSHADLFEVRRLFETHDPCWVQVHLNNRNFREELAILPSILDLVIEFKRRVHALSVIANHPGDIATVFHTLNDPIRARFNSIAYLNCHYRGADPFILPNFSPLNSLRSLALSFGDTTVQITVPPTWVEFHELFQACPQLEQLNFRNFNPSIDDEEYCSIRRCPLAHDIDLRNLQEFTMEAPIAVILKVVTNVQFPRLKSLAIRGTDGRPTDRIIDPASLPSNMDFPSLTTMLLTPMHANTARFLTKGHFPRLTRLALGPTKIDLNVGSLSETHSPVFVPEALNRVTVSLPSLIYLCVASDSPYSRWILRKLSHQPPRRLSFLHIDVEFSDYALRDLFQGLPFKFLSRIRSLALEGRVLDNVALENILECLPDLQDLMLLLYHNDAGHAGLSHVGRRIHFLRLEGRAAMPHLRRLDLFLRYPYEARTVKSHPALQVTSDHFDEVEQYLESRFRADRPVQRVTVDCPIDRKLKKQLRRWVGEVDEDVHLELPWVLDFRRHKFPF